MEERAATSVLDPATHSYDISLYDTGRDRPTRFTFDRSGAFMPAIWSPDASSLAFVIAREGTYALYRKAADLFGREELLHTEKFAILPANWPSGGHEIILSGSGIDSRNTIVAVPVTGVSKPVRRVVADNITAPRISPVGRSVAYASFESSRSEIYVRSYPEGAGKLQGSVNGGNATAMES